MFMEIEDVVLLVLDDWLQRVFVELQDLLVEDVVDVARQIRPEVT